MNSKALLVAQREFLDNVKTKGFWISILIFPIILTAAIVLPTVLEKTRSAREFAVIDQSGWVLDVLSAEGYIRGYETVTGESGKAEFEIQLKYFDGEPVIRELKRVSTPGRRVYAAVTDLPKVRNGLGVSIVSTSKGVMSDSRARSEHVGGEVLCTVF